MKNRNLIKSLFVLWSLLLAVEAAALCNKSTSAKENVYQSVIRFHVLANSDTKEDQQLKLNVRDAVLKYLQTTLRGAEDREQTEEALYSHLEEIEKSAEAEIKKQGYLYPVNVKLEEAYFPVKTYGDCTLPAGTYLALRIKIGKARGHNWWCVLFPQLCFADTIHAVVPEEEKEVLKKILTEEDYESLFRQEKDPYEIRSFLMDLILGERKADPAWTACLQNDLSFVHS